MSYLSPCETNLIHGKIPIFVVDHYTFYFQLPILDLLIYITVITFLFYYCLDLLSWCIIFLNIDFFSLLRIECTSDRMYFYNAHLYLYVCII